MLGLISHGFYDLLGLVGGTALIHHSMIVQSQCRDLINCPHGQGSAGNTVDILIQR